jgi:hypothetical protein
VHEVAGKCQNKIEIAIKWHVLSFDLDGKKSNVNPLFNQVVW